MKTLALVVIMLAEGVLGVALGVRLVLFLIQRKWPDLYEELERRVDDA